MLIAQVLAPVVVAFVTVSQGAMSNIEESRQVVARTATEWQALWRQHGQEGPAPSVDFAQAMVAGVFAGSKPTGGYTVEVTAVKTEGNRVVVEYRERQPAPDVLVIQVITSPFHLVRFPRTGGTVEFRRLDQ